MIFTIINSIIFTILGGLHIYWAVGGKVGLIGAVPEIKNESIFQSKGFIFATLVIAAGLLACAIMHWQVLNGAAWFQGIGFLVLTVLFTLRAIGDFNYVGFFKKKKGTLFAQRDTTIYIPLCLFIAFNAMMTYLG